MTMDSRKVFYVPDKHSIIDLAMPGEDGELRSGINRETLEQIRNRYPGAVVGDLATVAHAREEFLRSPPEEITQERFIEMLEVLPPMGWVRRRGSESFKLSEFTSGLITAIFARIGTRYFEMQDRCTMTHAEIVAACSKVA